jgi:hypothetical protein
LKHLRRRSVLNHCHGWRDKRTFGLTFSFVNRPGGKPPGLFLLRAAQCRVIENGGYFASAS